MSRNFYHCFPRPRKGSQPDGLAILRSICKHGLLLAPEVVTWLDPRTGTGLDRVTAEQWRASFTELAQDELPLHAKQFGDFAIGFNYTNFRVLGGLPVIYIPDSSSGSLLDQMGAHLLSNLASCSNLLDGLARVLSSDKCGGVFTVKNPGVAGCEVKFDDQEMQAVFKFLEMMQSLYRSDFRNMGRAVNVMAGFFYPTDNLRVDEILSYYRQREWRIVDGAIMNGIPVSNGAREDQVQELISLNESFFGKEVILNGQVCQLARECCFFKALGDKHVMEFASEVLVPEIYLKQAEEILSEFHFTAKVEAMPTQY